MMRPVETVPDSVNARNTRPSAGGLRGDHRPSTSKKMLDELLSLKQDLLQNQQMIRSELAMHKQQINEQIANVSNQKERRKEPETQHLERSNTFHHEMNKYHDRISSEIENLRKAIAHKNLDAVKKRARSVPTLESRFDVLQPRFIPPTPMLPRTAETEGPLDSASRMNTAFTALGVDQYLLEECKRN